MIKKSKQAIGFKGTDKTALAFPKKKVKTPNKKKKTSPEKIIQKQVEAYLTILGVRFFHIPDYLLMFIKVTPGVPQYLKNLVSQHFKGLPDLIIWHKNEKGFNHCLLLELKTETGKLSQGQKNWHKGLNVSVTYGSDEAIKEIDKFISFCEKN